MEDNTLQPLQPPSLAATVAKLCGFSIRNPSLMAITKDFRLDVQVTAAFGMQRALIIQTFRSNSRATNCGVCHQLATMTPSGPESKLAPEAVVPKQFRRVRGHSLHHSSSASKVQPVALSRQRLVISAQVWRRLHTPTTKAHSDEDFERKKGLCGMPLANDQ